MTTLLNPNCTAEGRSADNVLTLIRATGANIALVRDSAKLVAMCASVGIQTIFRAAGDDPAGNPLARDPAGFVNARIEAAPDATWIHLTNEVGFSRELDTWTLKAAAQAERRGKKVVAYNAATNQPLVDWKASEPAIRELVSRGHAIGAHFYADSIENTGGKAFLDVRHRVGGRWFMTEFAYAYADHTPDGGYHISVERGYRAELSPRTKYNDWLDSHMLYWAAAGMPLFLFSADHWPNNEAGKASGFGIEDEPAIVAHAAVINRNYPLQEKPTVVLPPTVNIPAAPGDATVMRVLPATLRLRVDTGLGAGIIRTLKPGEEVAVYTDTETAKIGGYPWVFVETQMDKGWAALRGGWGESFSAIDAPMFRLIHPVCCDSIITSMFGVPRDYNGDGVFAERHEGVDFAPAHKGCTPAIRAGAAGTVKTVSYAGDYGTHVVIESKVGADVYRVWYCHLAAEVVEVGETVRAGDFIGILGSTGNSTGPHLHLNVQHIGHGLSGYVIADAVDPLPLITDEPTTLALVA